MDQAKTMRNPTRRPTGTPYAPLLPLLLPLLLLVGACGDSGEGVVDPPGAGASTWSLIQSEILDVRCTSCHVEGNSDATRSQLVLTSDVAYQQLVDAPVQNPAAAADGLVRVSSQGVGGSQKSFLYEKINWPNEQHYYDEHQDYGSLMPTEGPLSYGQIRLLWEWMEAGAPREGVVADHLVLQDQRVYEPGPFVPLDPPAAGQGFQLSLGPIEIAPDSEREVFQYHELPVTGDIFVDRVEIAMRQGSHHFIAHTFEDGTPADRQPQPGQLRDLYGTGGELDMATVWPMLHHEFFTGTQLPRDEATFPPGVALRLPAGKGLDLNAHYVNRGAEPIVGQVQLNLHTVPASAVVHEAQILNLNHRDIELPPRQESTLVKDWYWTGRDWLGERYLLGDQHVRVIGLVSHAHEHNTAFHVYRLGGPQDGERVYASYDWQHPPERAYDPPLELAPGEGFRVEATYDNWTSQTLGFGLLSEDEMMILFGSYYLVDGP